jgi:hypothetical protein
VSGGGDTDQDREREMSATRDGTIVGAMIESAEKGITETVTVK